MYLCAGAAAFGLLDVEQAWPLFLKARFIQPDNLIALANMVKILTRKGYHGQIAWAARRCLCAGPAAPGAGSILASVWTSIARVGDATEVARSTLLVNPSMVSCWGRSPGRNLSRAHTKR